LVKNLEDEIKEAGETFTKSMSKYANGKSLLKLSAEDSLEILLYCMDRRAYMLNILQDYYPFRTPRTLAESAVISLMSGRKLYPSRAQVTRALESAESVSYVELDSFAKSNTRYVGSLLLKQYLERNSLDELLSRTIERIADKIIEYSDNETRGLYESTEFRLLASNPNNVKLPLNDKEEWSAEALAFAQEQNPKHYSAWLQLFRLCDCGWHSKPKISWLKNAKKLIIEIGSENVEKMITSVLPKVSPDHSTGLRAVDAVPVPIDRQNEIVLKGLIWCSGIIGGEAIANTLLIVGMESYKKVPNHGPRSGRVGNAAVLVLSEMPYNLGYCRLEKIKENLKNKTVLTYVERQQATMREKASAEESGQ